MVYVWVCVCVCVCVGGGGGGGGGGGLLHGSVYLLCAMCQCSAIWEYNCMSDALQ